MKQSHYTSHGRADVLCVGRLHFVFVVIHNPAAPATLDAIGLCHFLYFGLVIHADDDVIGADFPVVLVVVCIEKVPVGVSPRVLVGR